MRAFFISLLLISCGCYEPTIHDDFKAHVNSFIADSIRYKVDVSYASKTYSIVYAEDDELPFDVLGQCSIRGALLHPFLDYREIKIRKKKYSDIALKALMYHELSHCYLDRRYHINSRHCVLMNELVPQDEGYLKRNWNKLVEQLFRDCKE